MRTRRVLLGLWALVLGGASGCTDLETCGVQGDTQACTCSDGASGAQICRPEHIWGECDCSGAITSGDAGGTGGQSGGGGASGSGGSRAAGAGGSRAGAGGSTPPVDDEDGGAPITPAGSGGAGAGAGAAGAGSGGAGGAAGATPEPMSTAYRNCMNPGDCRGGSSCESGMDTLSLETFNVCAPPCSDVGECPVPEGSYDAVLVCEGGRCRLDCTGESFPLPAPASCPGGMVCLEPQLLDVASYCFDDGM